MKLFAFYIGGATETSLIELHDVRFVAAASLDDAIAKIKDTWWGTAKSLHLDCWGELTSADGYNITLRDTPYTGEDKLWFVNLGGYDPADFNELHQNVFVVAPTASKAQVRALKQAPTWQSRHRDYVHEIENLHEIGTFLPQGWYIHLEKTDAPVPFTFECGYWPIGKGARQPV